MTAPATIGEMVEQFTRNHSVYAASHYNEAQLRIEFLDPFFDALGWDMQNRLGYAEPYKDVVHEDAIKVGGATKAPDYCLPNRRHTQVFRRGQEARGTNSRRRGSGLPVAPLRLVGQIAPQHPHQFRRLRRLRLPR